MKTNWTILSGKLFNINLQSFRKNVCDIKMRRIHDVIDLLIYSVQMKNIEIK